MGILNLTAVMVRIHIKDANLYDIFILKYIFSFGLRVLLG